MELLKEILLQYSGLIYAIAGAITAWGLAELSRHLVNSYQKKQTLNSALSLLLELYFQIKRISNAYDQSQGFLKWYEKLLTENSFPQEVKNMINKEVSRKITPILSSVAVEDVKKLSGDYEKALEKLSCYYPVAAYRLRGRADINHILIDLDSHLKKIESQLPVEIGEYREIAEPVQTMLQPAVISDNLSILRDEIVDLSKSTSRKQRKAILATLDKIDTPDVSSKQYFDMLKEQLPATLEKALR